MHGHHKAAVADLCGYSMLPISDKPEIGGRRPSRLASLAPQG